MSHAKTLAAITSTPGPLPKYDRLSYATVADFCDSADRLRSLATHQNDLKDVQRPWTVKAILSEIQPPARVLEVGSGEPLAASVLASAGYDATICDPFDGSGHGPTEYQLYRVTYPSVRFRRDRYTPAVAQQDAAKPFDVICSISVLEHIHEPHLGEVFEAIGIGLRPGGLSIHCTDIVVGGNGTDYHRQQLERIVFYQEKLAGNELSSTEIASRVTDLFARAAADLETFYLSPQGHNMWRGGMTYAQFPFRKVISVQTIVRKKS